MHQHLCHSLSLGLGEHSLHSSSWVSNPPLSSWTALAAAIPSLWTGEAHWPSLVTPPLAEPLRLELGNQQVFGSRDHLHWEKEEELRQPLEAWMDREVQLIPMLPESQSRSKVTAC